MVKRMIKIVCNPRLTDVVYPLLSSMTGDMGDMKMETRGGVSNVTVDDTDTVPSPTLLLATQL